MQLMSPQVLYPYFIALLAFYLVWALPLLVSHLHLLKLRKMSTKPIEYNLCVATLVDDAVTCRSSVDKCPSII